MSNSVSGDFWSKLRKPPGGYCQSPAPTVPPDELTEPTPVEACSAKKPGMLFKTRKENGISEHSNTADSFGSSMLSLNKSTVSLSWADSVEESEELLTLNEDQDPPMTTLMTQHANGVGEAKVTILKQEKLIAELEDDIQAKAGKIQNLEEMADTRERRLDELQVVTQEQAIRISQLVNENTDKDDSILQLDKDLAAACATLQELELQIAENSRIPRSDSSTEIGEGFEESSGSECVPDVVPIPIVLETTQAVSKVKDVETGNDHALHNVEDATVGASQMVPDIDMHAVALSPVEFPALSPSMTAHGLQQTVFVTPETLKNVPPPPPPKKLTLGIDPSKFAKKSLSDTKRRAVLASGREDAEPPAIDPTKDIRRMSKAEREPYGWGPTVKIVLSTQDVVVVPQYMFMQVSPKAFKHWKENPNADSMTFASGAFTKKALAIHLEWITMHTHCNKVFSVTLKHDGSDRHNLELVRCARALGLTPMYMGHFTRKYCEQIRDGPSAELVALIEELSWDETDPIFLCLAHSWATQYAQSKPEDAESWNKKLTRLPRLSAKMQDIQIRKKFALGGTGNKGRGMSLTSSNTASGVPVITAAADTDPDAAWRASGPAYSR